jgi:predicted TIM-barrel enzyme
MDAQLTEQLKSSLFRFAMDAVTVRGSESDLTTKQGALAYAVKAAIARGVSQERISFILDQAWQDAMATAMLRLEFERRGEW